jgi:signal transduction histidine kinase
MKHLLATLRVRIIVLVLLAVVPAWVMILYTVSAQRRSTGNEILKDALNFARLTAYKEEQLIEGTRQLLFAIARFLSFQERSADDCNAFLTQPLADFKRYANFGVITVSGKVLCSAAPLKVPLDANDRIWFDRVLQTRDFVIGEYEIGSITTKPVLVMAAPVLDHLGRASAVAFAAIDLSWLDQFNTVGGGELPPKAYLELVDRRGMILAHTPETPGRVGQHLQTPLLHALRGSPAELLRAPGPQGDPYLYAVTAVSSKLRAEAVLVVFGIPEKLAFAQADHALWVNLFWLGLVSLLVVSTAWFGGEIFILRLLDALVKTSKRLAAGDLNARTGLPHGTGELGQLAKAFDNMAVALEQRECEHRQAEAQIRQSREQLRQLSTHAQSVREEERTRIAREIHDDLGQALTALKIDLSWLSKRVSTDQSDLRPKIDSMARVIDAGMETVHRLSAELRPGILDDLGLAEAIEWQAEEFQKRTGIPCQVELGCEGIDLTKELSTAIFRIFQETLTNVARHAQASTVEVALEVREGKLVLVVKDDGRGITAEEMNRSSSYGILGIRERAASLAGEVSISGAPDQGTSVIVTIPLGSEATRHD